MFDCFGVKFVSKFLEKKPNFQNGQKSREIGQHGHNLMAFSQATGQTWYHTGEYYLSALEFLR